MSSILIKFNKQVARGQIADNQFYTALERLLPLQTRVSTWGEEIYFPIAFSMPLNEGAKAEVEPGDIAFWPDGNMFCIFYGPTPASTSEKPMSISPVNVVGKIEGDLSLLKKIQPGDEIEISMEKM